MDQSYTLPKISRLPLAHVFMIGLLIVELLGATNVLPISDKPIWLGVVATGIGSWAVIGLARWRQRQRGDMWLTEWAAGLIVALIYLDALGNMFDWYDSWRWFDVVVHTSSGLVGTAVAWQILYALTTHYALEIPLWVHALFALFTFAFLAVLVELLEFVADRIYGIEGYWLGSGIDTVGDLAAGVSGGLLTIGGAYLYWKIRPQSRPG
ncbi:MAG: hypothetical protein WEC84_02335 [Candidatus Andersenbacteria bacterium]